MPQLDFNIAFNSIWYLIIFFSFFYCFFYFVFLKKLYKTFLASLYYKFFLKKSIATNRKFSKKIFFASSLRRKDFLHILVHDKI